MQFQTFIVPAADATQALTELNAFLRGHKILEVESHFVEREQNAAWHFCVKYLEGGGKAAGVRADYKLLLKEEQFAIFSKLRQARKQIAEETDVPHFVIFTDEELAGIAQLDEINLTNLVKVKGVGAKKVEKYGERILQGLNG